MDNYGANYDVASGTWRSHGEIADRGKFRICGLVNRKSQRQESNAYYYY